MSVGEPVRKYGKMKRQESGGAGPEGARRQVMEFIASGSRLL
jgi:hypothetical protein